MIRSETRRLRICDIKWASLASQQVCLCRQYSRSPTLYSGHNKWSTIKHDKARKDNARQKQITIWVNEIATASRLGGPDPNMNPRLALAITKAKKGSAHKHSIESAIARGQGLSSSGAKLESIIEGTCLPQIPGSLILIDCLTENPTQTRIDIRGVLKKFDASLIATSYMFEKIGRIAFEPKENVSFEIFAEAAIDAEVRNFEEDEDGNFVVDTEVSDITKVTNQVADQLALEVKESEIGWQPTSTESIEDEEVQAQFHDLVSQLEDLPSVKAVYTNEGESAS